MKAICFDLNKTLINENSWKDLNLALGVKPEEDEMLMNWGERGIISDATGQQILLNIYKESKKHTKNNILKILSNYTYKKGAKEVVDYFLQKGFQVFLISGSMNILVETVARELKIDIWRANNKFTFDHQDYLEDIVTIDNDKVTKLYQLQEICKENNLNIENVFCVGDGDNDIEIFKATKRGITFNGSKIEQYAYKVIEELNQLKDII